MITKRKRTIALVAVILVLVLGWGLMWYQSHSRDEDPDLALFLAKITQIDSYSQHVETDMVFPDRHLKVKGQYLVDRRTERYSTFSTTTIVLPDSGAPVPHDFTLGNIAIGKDVYNRIYTRSPVLVNTIPSSDEWRHFTADTIPVAFKNIAIPGPLLDNLLLFSNNGRFLTLVTSEALPASASSTATHHFVFKLSGESPPHNAGTLRALISRIGPGGSVEAWSSTDGMPILLHFSNDTYNSTTTISNTATPLFIEAPIKSIGW
jgi:hypothetical protein